MPITVIAMPSFGRDRVWQDGVSDDATAGKLWMPRTLGERTLELQLACAHPKVFLMAAEAGIGVPDPEDATSVLDTRVTRFVRASRQRSPATDTCIAALRSTMMRLTLEIPRTGPVDIANRAPPRSSCSCERPLTGFQQMRSQCTACLPACPVAACDM